MKEFKKLFIGLAYASLFNMLISGFIYSFIHEDKTEIQVFLHTPKSFIWNFK